MPPDILTLLTPGLIIGLAIFAGAMAERADFYTRRIGR